MNGSKSNKIGKVQDRKHSGTGSTFVKRQTLELYLEGLGVSLIGRILNFRNRNFLIAALLILSSCSSSKTIIVVGKDSSQKYEVEITTSDTSYKTFLPAEIKIQKENTITIKILSADNKARVPKKSEGFKSSKIENKGTTKDGENGTEVLVKDSKNQKYPSFKRRNSRSRSYQRRNNARRIQSLKTIN